MQRRIQARLALVGLMAAIAFGVVFVGKDTLKYSVPIPSKIAVDRTFVGQVLHALDRGSVKAGLSLNPGRYPVILGEEQVTISVNRPTTLSAQLEFHVSERSESPYSITPRVSMGRFTFSPPIVIEHASGMAVRLTRASIVDSAPQASKRLEARLEPAIATTFANFIIRLLHSPAQTPEYQRMEMMVRGIIVERLDAFLKDGQIQLKGLRAHFRSGKASVQIPQFELRIPKAYFLAAVEKTIPNESPLPDWNLGNKAIYQDIRFTGGKVTGHRPTLRVKDQQFVFNVTPTISANLYLKYEHVWAATEVRTIAVVDIPFLGRKRIKQAVPVVKREWRPRGPLPNSMTGNIQGVARVGLTEGESLSKQSIRSDIECESFQIANLKLNTGDALGGIASDIIRIGAAAGPWNKTIRGLLSRRIEIPLTAIIAEKEQNVLKQLTMDRFCLRFTHDHVIFSGAVNVR